MHPKWLERHFRHLHQALAALEEGDATAACYNAYVSAEALAKGALGYHPYGQAESIKRLPALVREIFGGNPPPDAEKCAQCLERKAFSNDAQTCIKCAELLADLIHNHLKTTKPT